MPKPSPPSAGSARPEARPAKGDQEATSATRGAEYNADVTSPSSPKPLSSLGTNAAQSESRFAAPSSDLEPVETLIIGAGPAGLATAACLRRSGVPPEGTLVLERHDAAGSSWRSHYERLHLHTMKRHSHLPFRPFPAHYPQYPSRQQVVDYLDDYAAAFDIRPRFGHTVTRASLQAPTSGGASRWTIETNRGTFAAKNLVCATGYSNRPYTPTWPGQESFTGEILHSKSYLNADRWRGKRVLVVGAGNSAAEIALDCFERGVTETTLSIRSPLHVVPRDTFGLIPSQLTGMFASKLPPKLADRLLLPVLSRVVGDLSPWGIRRPAIGPAEQVATLGKVPLIDIGTVSLIKQGVLQVAPEIQAFTADGVRFVDGQVKPFDAVVCATGYRPALRELFHQDDRPLDCFDERGYPLHYGTEVPGKRLWFVGFRNPLVGQLYDIHQESLRAAEAIAA